MSLRISCAFATSLETPGQIELAERLGYDTAWCYDSPALYPDVWVTLALAAQRTSRIRLGPGVLVPSLRHVMTNAAAVATLEALAPGRIVVGVGAGATGRLAMGQRPLTWASVEAYTRALRALLRGEDVEWDGGMLRMLHPGTCAPARPLHTPVVVAAQGPKGVAVAKAVADGIFTVGPAGGFPWVAELMLGTVLDEGEPAGSARALAAAGPGAAVFYHLMHDGRGWGDMTALPGGDEYRRRAEARPPASRHLDIHANHLIGLNPLDDGLVTGDVVAALGISAEPGAWRQRLAASEAAGVTEVVFQPAGPDIARELEVFMAMASG
jgi:5,10-methylenetetrahydromethanopterin reductase